MPKREITDYFDNEFTQYSVNNAFQSIANYVDGFKPTQRKVIHTIKKFNVTNKTKVDSIANDTAKETDYAGGSQNIEGVIVTIARQYTGTNNLTLLETQGNFGIRQNPSAAGSRYIYAKKGKLFDWIIKKEDDDLLIEQEIVKGHKIEPRIFYPIIPMILVNGSEGIGTGFSQKILPRNPDNIIKYLIDKLLGKKSSYSFTPYWNGYDGNIRKGENKNQWIVEGKFEKINTTTIEITEIPINTSVSSYIKILNKLEDDKKIVSYKDLSNPKTDKIKFQIKMKRDVLASLDDEALFKLLKLRSTITENITCVDENNRIVVFDSINLLMDKWFDLRYSIYQKRKQNQIKHIDFEIEILLNRIGFIQDIIDGKIIIQKRSKKSIEEDLKQKEFKKIESSYDYLLNMSLYSLTDEKIKEMEKKKQMLLNEKDRLEKSTIEELWIADLKALRKMLK